MINLTAELERMLTALAADESALPGQRAAAKAVTRPHTSSGHTSAATTAAGNRWPTKSLLQVDRTIRQLGLNKTAPARSQLPGGPQVTAHRFAPTPGSDRSGAVTGTEGERLGGRPSRWRARVVAVLTDRQMSRARTATC
jgi:hypothetical protein